MVGGFGGSFTVVVPALVVPPVEEEVPEAPVPTTPTIIWPLIGGIIAGVVVVGLLIFFLAPILVRVKSVNRNETTGDSTLIKIIFANILSLTYYIIP